MQLRCPTLSHSRERGAGVPRHRPLPEVQERQSGAPRKETHQLGTHQLVAGRELHATDFSRSSHAQPTQRFLCAGNSCPVPGMVRE